MTDFTRWLYANYIKPHIEQQDRTGYEQPLDLPAVDLMPQQREDCERLLEFYSANAFLLGLRTGAGLSDACKG